MLELKPKVFATCRNPLGEKTGLVTNNFGMIIRIHNTDGSTKGSGLPIYSSVSEFRAWELASSGQLRLLRIYEIKKVRFKKLSE